MLFALAVLMPPHGRVNYRCWPVWNSNRSNLNVVWNGAEYNQLWKFKTEVDGNYETCRADTCVQRLWCTDSGVVGRYTRDRSQDNTNKNLRLAYAWLLNTSLTGSRTLAVNGRENGDSTLMEYTNAYGPSTVLVAGSTLFFYTFSSGTHFYGLPRLSSLVFAEYAAGKNASQLVRTGIDAFNVLGYNGPYKWYSEWSPIYPSGASAVTISVEDFYGGDNWAIDVALTLSATSATRSAVVHLPRDTIPSVRSTSREVLTTPDYSCRVTTANTGTCYVLGSGKYTWAS